MPKNPTDAERLDDARQRFINEMENGSSAEEVADAVELYVLWLIEYHHGRTEGLWRRDGTLAYMMGEDHDAKTD